MKTIERTTQEYKTPKCKVVNVHVEGLICLSPNGYGDDGEAGGNVNVDYDDYDY